MAFSSENKRNPYRRLEVVSMLRSRIISGEFKPGERLPSRVKLAEQLDIAPLTLQDVMNDLTEDGWIESRNRLATRIVEKPPHLNRFALLLIEPEAEKRTFREQALIQAAKSLSAKYGWQIDLQFVLENNMEETQAQVDFKETAKRDYYGGFMVAASTGWAKAHLSKLTTPNVLLSTSLPERFRSAWSFLMFSSTTETDENRRILHYLKDRGCHRIGFFGSVNKWEQNKADEFRALTESCGMVCLPGFFQNTHHNVDKYRFAEELMDLMFHPDNPVRPDGFIVKNEGVLPPLQKTLHQYYGNKAFEAVKIASVGNLPVLPETDLDVRFFGIDMTRTLENAVRGLIDYRLTGQFPEEEQVIFNRLNNSNQSTGEQTR